MGMLATAWTEGGSHPLAQFIVQLLAFILLILVLLKFVKPALGKMLGERTKGVEETFRKIEEDSARASEELSEVKRRLSEVQGESERRHKAAMDDAERTRAQALGEATQQTQALLDKARREIQIEREKAVLDLRHEAERLTLEAADHLVQAAMNDALQQKMVDTYLGKIDSVEKP